MATRTKQALETMLRLEKGLESVVGFDNRVAYLQKHWPEYNIAMRLVVAGYAGWQNCNSAPHRDKPTVPAICHGGVW